MGIKKSSLALQIDAVEQELKKSQIVEGGNSERQQWAGSKIEDQKTPTSTPKGTDYVPPSSAKTERKVNKNVHEMDTDELEGIIKLRKSGKPLIALAEQEIAETLPEVQKAICPACNGTTVHLHKGRSSSCEDCAGFGFVYSAETEEQAAQIEAICKKYNVTSDSFQKGMEEENDLSKDDDNSVSDEEIRELSEQLKAAGKKDADEEDEKEQPSYGGGEKTEKSILSLSSKVERLNKGISQLLEASSVLASKVADLEDRISLLQSGNTTTLKAQGQILKSLGNASVSRPTAPPRSMSNLQVIEKSFSDQAPGGETMTAEQRFDFLKKSASAMSLDKSLGPKRLDHKVVLALDAGHLPDQRTIDRIWEYGQKNLDKMV